MNATSMSLADCAKSAAAAHRRIRKTARAKPSAVSISRRSDTGFKGAEFNRLTLDWNSSRVPADDEIRHVMGRLRARARDLSRNNPYVRQYLNLLRVNVVGPEGAKLQAQVRNNSGELARRVNDRIEESWADWCSRPTVDGKMSMVDFQHLTLETVAKEGEAFVRIRRGFDNKHGMALEAIDPDLLDELLNRPSGTSKAEIRMAVEVNEYGGPIAYHVWDSPLTTGGMTNRRRLERVPADEIIHLYRMDRPNLTRGVTWLAPVMFALNMLDGYEDAEITACRLAASSTGVLTRKDGGADLQLGEDGQVAFEANPGSFMFAPEGYDLATWDPNHPNSNYQSFVKGCLRRIASGLGVSYNVLANDLEGVNYSSMRSGVLVERDLWRSLQCWWESSFLRPVYSEWLNLALLNGALVLDSRDPRKFLSSRWVSRGWQWVDPSKDTDAGIKEVQSGLGSRTALLAEQGRDFEEVLEELAAEKKMAALYGVDIVAPEAGTQAKPRKAPKEDEDEGGDDAERAIPAPVTHNGHAVNGSAGAARRWS